VEKHFKCSLCITGDVVIYEPDRHLILLDKILCNSCFRIKYNSFYHGRGGLMIVGEKIRHES
jgi:hypothetical protein